MKRELMMLALVIRLKTAHGLQALMSHVVFFFQAEDGIRDYKVTGVQTCALPICHLRRLLLSVDERAAGRTLVNGEEQPAKVTRQLRAGDVVRIETPGGGGYGPE